MTTTTALIFLNLLQTILTKMIFMFPKILGISIMFLPKHNYYSNNKSQYCPDLNAKRPERLVFFNSTPEIFRGYGSCGHPGERCQNDTGDG